MFQTIVSGIGSYVPEQVLSNTDLEQMVDTSDEWIVTRTGIRERRVASPEQATSDLAFHAAKAALANAGLDAKQLDMIIVATSTPDHQFPPVACQLQHRLGCGHLSAFDLSATCVGFLLALEAAQPFIATGKHQHILVVGADTLTRITDYTDRSTCILFGDGAGAFILSRKEDDRDAGFIHASTHADGTYFPAMYVPGGGSRHPHQPDTPHQTKMVMDGRKIFKLAVTSMAKTVKETIQAAGISTDDIDWLIPHQANRRIIEAVAEQLDFPREKVVTTVERFGNNSAATIPLAMDTMVREGKIKRGDLIMLAAFGAGLIWGSLLLRY